TSAQSQTVIIIGNGSTPYYPYSYSYPQAYVAPYGSGYSGYGYASSYAPDYGYAYGYAASGYYTPYYRYYRPTGGAIEVGDGDPGYSRLRSTARPAIALSRALGVLS